MAGGQWWRGETGVSCRLGQSPALFSGGSWMGLGCDSRGGRAWGRVGATHGQKLSWKDLQVTVLGMRVSAGPPTSPCSYLKSPPAHVPLCDHRGSARFGGGLRVRQTGSALREVVLKRGDRSGTDLAAGRGEF